MLVLSHPLLSELLYFLSQFCVFSLSFEILPSHSTRLKTGSSASRPIHSGRKKLPELHWAQNSRLVKGFHPLFHESGVAPLFHLLSASFSVPGVCHCVSLYICPWPWSWRQSNTKKSSPESIFGLVGTPSPTI